MAKPEKTRNLGTWTEAKYWGAIRSHLRRLFRHNWEPKKRALLLARRPSQNSSRPQLKWEFQCVECKKWFPREGVEIDHVVPCGSLLHEDDLKSFLSRYLPESVSAYQILCEEDHNSKTQHERAERSSKKK